MSTMTGAAMAPAPSWREEARRDRLARAQIDQARETARLQARITEREAAERIRRDAAEARRTRRAMAAAARSARFAALAAWAAGHVTDLLFIPVITVPAALAWTAMATYGASLYGTPGRALPAFSEGAMWAFAAAVTIIRHRHPDRPTWHLRTGIVVFAAFGAALNFAHGLTISGPVSGVVMALVSVAGVTAHQLVTAGPRRSRADREAARTARLIARREHAAHRAAIRRALVDLDENGTARLVFEPGAAELKRHFGRVRLAPVLTETAQQAPDTAFREMAALTEELGLYGADNGADSAPDTNADTAADTTPATMADTSPAPRRTAPRTRPGQSTAARVAALRTRHPDMSAADIAARLKVSDRTVRRYLSAPAAADAAQPAAA